MVELSLTFGEQPDGGVSVGVSLRIAAVSGGEEQSGNITAAEREAGTTKCLAWIEDVYRLPYP